MSHSNSSIWDTYYGLKERHEQVANSRDACKKEGKSDAAERYDRELIDLERQADDEASRVTFVSGETKPASEKRPGSKV